MGALIAKILPMLLQGMQRNDKQEQPQKSNVFGGGSLGQSSLFGSMLGDMLTNRRR